MRLDAEKRAEIVAHLVECNSIRGTARLCGVYKRTVMDLLIKVGQGCERLHNRLVRGLAIHRIECDEIVTHIHTRQKNLRGDEPPEHGEVWTYTGLATTSKLLIAYRTGKRSQDMTDAFMWDLRSRLTVMPELVSDGLHCYAASVARSFNGAIDYAQLVKTPSRKGKTKPGVPFVVKRAMVGAPDMSRVSTSYVERHNGTIRDQIKRFARRTRCHSKKLENHCAAVALFVGWYNLVRHHGTLGTTPAVAARLTDEPWTLSQLIEAALSEPLGYQAPKPAALTPRPGSPGAARQTSSGTWLRAVSTRGTPVADRASPPVPAVWKAVPQVKQLSLFPDDLA